MAEINKAKKRQASSNSARYGAQYGVTYNNKRRALNKHIAFLELVLKALTATETPTERQKKKMENIKAAVVAAMDALKALPLKKGGR